MTEAHVAFADDPAVQVDAAKAIAVARRALEQAARANPALAGIERLLDEVVDRSLPAEAAALLRLLDGEGDVDATSLGLPLVGARLVVACVRQPRHLAMLTADLREDRQTIAVLQAGRLNVLVRNVPRRAGDDKGMHTALRVASMVMRLEPDAHVGISAQLTATANLHAAARDAADAAALAARRGCPLLVIDEVWGDVVTARLRDALPGCLTTSHPLAWLAEHDRRHRSDLVSTVGSWLAHRCDTAETARHLSLHPNTLRYRLRRAQELSGLDLRDPTQAIVAQLMYAATPRPVRPARPPRGDR